MKRREIEDVRKNMIRVHLFVITVTVSVRKPDPEAKARRCENQIRVNGLVEEMERKRDEHIYMK